MAKHFQKVKLRHAESVQRRSAERKNPNYPRISLKSLFYVTRIYRKAVGARTIFFVICFFSFRLFLPEQRLSGRKFQFFDNWKLPIYYHITISSDGP